MTGDGVAVLIMARVPRPGAVKTRLQPLLGAEGCARLQAALLERTLQLAEEAAPGRSYLALDGPHPMRGGVRLLMQHGADLGARMRNAVEQVRADRAGPVLVIGTDVPTLRVRHLRAAAAILTGGTDVVFGPAVDGGYYLAGLRSPDASAAVFAIDPRLWGGPDVLAASLAVTASHGLTSRLLEPLRDLDTPDDVGALLDEGVLPPALTRLLQPAVAPS